MARFSSRAFPLRRSVIHIVVYASFAYLGCRDLFTLLYSVAISGRANSACNAVLRETQLPHGVVHDSVPVETGREACQCAIMRR